MIESFEDARIFAQVIMSDCDAPIISRLQRAHEHEIEHLRRSRFREGYEAGRRSMDAEHYQLKLRLQGLKFGDGSHENLSRLAYAIYPCPTGWGKESCEGLRDKLIELLGGVHDEPAPIPASRCACDADCDCGNQQPQAVACDVLGIERHKAVCRLREFVPMIGHKPTEEASKLIRCITGNDDSHVACGNDLEETRDRLIHLLGGDEPLPNLSEPNLPKSVEVVKPESEDGGEVTITDELRKFATDPLLGYASQELHVERITAIADRIDEQFNRICWQQEAVLQSTIDEMVEERDELQKKLDDMREQREHWADEATEMFRLFFSHEEYCMPNNPSEMVATEVCKLRHELEDTRAALNRAAGRWAKDDAEKRELQERPDDYERHDTAEDIVRDLRLGLIADREAVRRIGALHG